MTQYKIDELKRRMYNHTVLNDTALVIITAGELSELLELAQQQIDHTCQVYYPIDIDT